MEIIEILKSLEPKKALAFGIGGGGDIVSTIPVANFLGHFGFETLHGSVFGTGLLLIRNPGQEL